MTVTFKPAERRKRKLRLGIDGPSGSGKTLTGLAILRGVVGPDGRIAVADSEKESSLEYAGIFPGTQQPSGFDVMALDDCSPESYIAAIDAAVKEGYDGLLIDSVSHEWAGKNGILESVDKAAGDDAYFSKKGWRAATPKHTRFIEKVVGSPIHVVVTMRVKSEYVIEKNAEGKNAPRKIGLQPIQRDGFDYEFSILASMDTEHNMRITKSRCLDRDEGGKLLNALEGAIIPRPGIELGEKINEWLNAPPGVWEAPTYARSFVVNDKTIVSGGITKDTYVTVANLAGKVDKKHGPGTTRAMVTGMGAVSVASMNEEQGLDLLQNLNLRLSAPVAHVEAK
jgi:hypothetical protein